MSSDKLLGFLMIIFSFAILGTTITFLLILPSVDYEQFAIVGYFVMAGIISFAVLVITMIVAWIGFTFLKTKTPEIILDDVEDQKLDE